MEEIDQSFGHHWADSLRRRQRFLAAFGQRGAAQLLDRPETFQEIARGDNPDVADAEPEQEARSVGLTLSLDRGEEVVDRLLLPALAAEQFITVTVQPEDVGG